MSVRSADRTQSLMEVQLKAIDILSYTMQAAGNERIVPKRDRWSLGNRLIDSALSISGHIDLANTMMLSCKEEASQRRFEQRQALADTYRLMTLINVAHELSRFPSEKQVFWIGLVMEEQELIRGWIESDRKRAMSKMT